jgi:hypothetical protein
MSGQRKTSQGNRKAAKVQQKNTTKATEKHPQGT